MTRRWLDLRERSRRSNDQSSVGDYAQGGVESIGEDTVAGGAGFFNLARNDPSMVDIAQNPSKSLIVKLPANKAVKPEGSNFGKNDLNALARTQANDGPTQEVPMVYNLALNCKIPT